MIINNGRHQQHNNENNDSLICFSCSDLLMYSFARSTMFGTLDPANEAVSKAWAASWINNKTKQLILNSIISMYSTVFIQKTRHKNLGLFKDFPAPNIFFHHHSFLIDCDLNRALQNWDCFKHGTLWNLIKFFHWRDNMICYTDAIQGLLSTDQKLLFFKDYKAFKKTVHFKELFETLIIYILFEKPPMASLETYSFIQNTNSKSRDVLIFIMYLCLYHPENWRDTDNVIKWTLSRCNWPLSIG